MSDDISRNAGWPEHLPVSALRVARPTADLEAARRFYRDGLGLPVLAEFRGHDGYDGVVLGLPGTTVHLEITARDGQTPDPVSGEHQLVLYFHGDGPMRAAVDRLVAAGHRHVTPDNPYWERRGCVAFRDPDGWLLLLAPFVFGSGNAS